MYCGVDMTEIDRIAKLSENPRFLTRVYVPEEWQLTLDVNPGRKAEILAGRFAAKEASAKALLSAAESLGYDALALRSKLTFTSIVTLRSPSGAPQLELRDAALEGATALGLTTWSISLSHTRALAIAMVTLSK